MDNTELKNDFENLINEIATKVIESSSTKEISNCSQTAIQTIQTNQKRSLLSMQSAEEAVHQMKLKAIAEIENALNKLVKNTNNTYTELVDKTVNKFHQRTKDTEKSFEAAQVSIDQFRKESDKLTKLSTDLRPYEEKITNIAEMIEILEATTSENAKETNNTLRKSQKQLADENKKYHEDLSREMTETTKRITNHVGRSSTEVSNIIVQELDKLRKNIYEIQHSIETDNRDLEKRQENLGIRIETKIKELHQIIETMYVNNTKKTGDEFRSFEEKVEFNEKKRRTGFRLLFTLNTVLVLLSALILYRIW